MKRYLNTFWKFSWGGAINSALLSSNKLQPNKLTLQTWFLTKNFLLQSNWWSSTSVRVCHSKWTSTTTLSKQRFPATSISITASTNLQHNKQRPNNPKKHRRWWLRAAAGISSPNFSSNRPVPKARHQFCQWNPPKRWEPNEVSVWNATSYYQGYKIFLELTYQLQISISKLNFDFQSIFKIVAKLISNHTSFQYYVNS